MDSLRFEEGGIKVEVTEEAVREYVRQKLGDFRTQGTLRVPSIGALWPEQGGIFGGFVKGRDSRSVPIIVPENIEGVLAKVSWGSRGKEEPSARDEWDGPANTLALLNSKHAHPAASKAAECRVGGFKDWYLMAKREAPVLYANLPDLLGKLGWCWTSTESNNTEFSAYDAWCQHFSGGHRYFDGKGGDYSVFPVRRPLLSDLVI